MALKGDVGTDSPLRSASAFRLDWIITIAISLAMPTITVMPNAVCVLARDEDRHW